MRLGSYSILLAVLCSAPASAQNVIPSWAQDAVARSIDSDICFPADSDEYEELGKNAILMLRSSSAMSAELPLKAVYVRIDDVKVPLQRIITLEKTSTRRGRNDYTEQTSFYLLPIGLLKKAGRLEADFQGGRDAFGIMSWAADGILENAPAFARLDVYDTPREPNQEVLVSVLRREYASYF